MDIQAKDLAFEQEGDNSFYEAVIKESDFEFKDGKISLMGSINSEIPLDASLEVYYRNTTNGDDLLSLFEKPIEIKSGDNSFNVSVTKEKLDRIKKYPFQVIKVTLNGSGEIKSNQEIKFKIAKILEAAIEKASKDTPHLDALSKYDMPMMWLNSKDYTSYIKEIYDKERNMVNRLNLKEKP